MYAEKRARPVGLRAQLARLKSSVIVVSGACASTYTTGALLVCASGWERKRGHARRTEPHLVREDDVDAAAQPIDLFVYAR